LRARYQLGRGFGRRPPEVPDHGQILVDDVHRVPGIALVESALAGPRVRLADDGDSRITAPVQRVQVVSRGASVAQYREMPGTDIPPVTVCAANTRSYPLDERPFATRGSLNRIAISC